MPPTIESLSTADVEGQGARYPEAVTVFLCANCSRPARKPTSAGRPSPKVPDFHWSFSVRQVLLPCTGRLQPEQMLKAFESGADLVCVIGCHEGNCHHLEGSRRCARRVDHVRSILQEIGLGSERLMFFTLPGTAAEDLALGEGVAEQQTTSASHDSLVSTIREQVLAAVEGLPPSPLHQAAVEDAASDSAQEVDTSNDDNED